MDVAEAIETRIELRSYADEPVDGSTKRAILNAGRLSPSGRNTQHWGFIIVDDIDRLAGLAERSSSGGWVADASFAVAICTDPSYDFHEIDAGRAITHMQLAAWELGVGSCIYTPKGPDPGEYLEVPDEYELTLVAGFGYPDGEVKGRKDREALETIAYTNAYGAPLTLED